MVQSGEEEGRKRVSPNDMTGKNILTEGTGPL